MDESFISMAFKQMGVAVKGIKVIKSKTTGYEFNFFFFFIVMKICWRNIEYPMFDKILLLYVICLQVMINLN